MKNIKTVITLAFVLFALALTSCRKNSPIDGPNFNGTADLRVSQNFDWSTTQEVDFNIVLSGNDFLPLKSKISLYVDDPSTGAPLISSGSVSLSQAYVGKVKIPSYVKEMFIKLETTTGNIRIEKVNIVNQQLAYTFTSGVKMVDAVEAVDVVPDEGPDCDDCDVVLSGNQPATISGGKTYCVTDSYAGHIEFQPWNGGGTLKVCGIATLKGSTELGNNCKVIVTKEGQLTIDILSMYGSPTIAVYAKAKLFLGNQLTTSGYFENHGQIIVKDRVNLQNLSAPAINNGTITLESGSFEMQNATLENNGVLNIPGHFHLNTNSGLTNTGKIVARTGVELNGAPVTNTGELKVLDGYFNVNAGGKLYNKGTVITETGNINFNSGVLSENYHVIISGKDINLNGGSKLINYCQMISKRNFDVNSGGFEMVNGYLKVAQKLTLNGGASIKISKASMISTDKLVMNASIYGSDDRNTVLAQTHIVINSNNVISGPIEAASQELKINAGTPPSKHIINGATFVKPDEMTNFIPITGCNPEGVGSQGIVDTDNDGVPDDLDDFPNDPERAFRSWYPSKTTFATLAYEDLWPGLGDFDFNDVVVDFQYEMITNAKNELKDMVGRFHLKAAGASLNNGFAVSMPFAPDKVQRLEGTNLVGEAIALAANGVEDGHTNETVIVVLDAIGTLYGEFLNTQPERPYVETDMITLKMVLGTAVADFGVAPFNPFIFINQERGKEVHLIDHKPTELVDASYFGMWEDDSKPDEGKYYQTDKRLPWAIEIPVQFDYPVETVDILLTHLKFAEWAMSSGTEYQDWYLNKPGYRNEENIYKRPQEKR